MTTFVLIFLFFCFFFCLFFFLIITQDSSKTSSGRTWLHCDRITWFTSKHVKQLQRGLINLPVCKITNSFEQVFLSSFLLLTFYSFCFQRPMDRYIKVGGGQISCQSYTNILKSIQDSTMFSNSANNIQMRSRYLCLRLPCLDRHMSVCFCCLQDSFNSINEDYKLNMTIRL